jgi:hypothetical protein
MSVRDFVQEWASARNYFEGQPIYEDQETSLARYLDFQRDPAQPTDRFFIQVNAHPPTSVLLALPLAHLDYPDAVLAWNLISLAALGASAWLMNRSLRVASSPWALLPLACFLLLCGAFRQQVIQGQLNLVLLLLLTGTWAADRIGRPLLAGTLLGTAAAVKLFPGFLLLYFLVRRDWRAVAAGAASFVLLGAITAGVLGIDAYRDYVGLVVPHVRGGESSWLNSSLAGFWARLFDPATQQERVDPLLRSAALARGATLVCRAAVVVLVGWSAWRAPTTAGRDLAFALAMVGMLLVSPVTWDHYFLLLALPVLVVWQALPSRGIARPAFALVPAILSLNLAWFFQLIPGGRTAGWAGPGQVLAVLSLPFYALVALFVVGLVELRRLVEVKAGEPPGLSRRG